MVTKYDSTLILALRVFKIFRRILFMKKNIALMLTGEKWDKITKAK